MEDAELGPEKKGGIVIGVRVTEEVVQKLDEMTEKLNAMAGANAPRKTRSDMIREILNRAVKRVKKA